MPCEVNNAADVPYGRVAVQEAGASSGLVGAALGGATAWLAAQAHRRSLQLQVLHLQAEVVAAKIDRFIGQIESEIGWTTQLPWSAETIELWRVGGVHAN